MRSMTGLNFTYCTTLLICREKQGNSHILVLFLLILIEVRQERRLYLSLFLPHSPPPCPSCLCVSLHSVEQNLWSVFRRTPVSVLKCAVGASIHILSASEMLLGHFGTLTLWDLKQIYYYFFKHHSIWYVISCTCPGSRSRYRLSGLIIPSLRDWMESTFGANLQHKSPATVSLHLSHLVLVKICVHLCGHT